MPDDLYTTLVLCPVCGAEMDRITHPAKKLHSMAAPLTSGDRRRKHGVASLACARDRRWIRGCILVPLGKPEPKS
jgi:hypothetical protein